VANQKKDSYAGGLAILAAAGYLCLKGLKQVDARLKKQAEQKRSKK
jgi:hypothetical protein